MSAAVKPTTEGNVAAFVVSVGLHSALVLLPLLATWHSHVRPPPPELPNNIAMVGNSIEVDAPTPDVAATPASPAAATEAQPVDVKSLPTEVAPATEPAPAAAPPQPHPKPKLKPPPSDAAAAGTTGAEAASTGAPASGTFGQAGLAPGVRRLGYAFTRAIPAATPGDSAWRELPVGHVGTIRIELAVDAENHLGALKQWQAHPGEPAPPAALERMVERTLILLRAGQFALSGSDQPGSERLTIDVTLRDESADADGAEVVVQKKFDGATPAHPGNAYFRYGTGRAFEAKVTISSSGR
ncbi:MAG TPA: hypothetical protein VNG33_05475 [Polyangiaceae bacterium]|nr:hypothetical protein [Polyangiaceae bacterium]